MSSPTVAAGAARLLLPLFALALGSGLVACGSDGGVSTFLPPGRPTSAPPGNFVLYAAMALGNRIDAYRLGTDGLLPSQPFDTIFVNNPRRLLVADGVLYATTEENIISIKLGEDGSMPGIPSSSTFSDENYDPVDLVERLGVLYVAAAGFETVQSFVLEDDGDLPVEPTASGTGEIQAEYSSLVLHGPYLYAAARDTEYIDIFLLRPDGNVPVLGEFLSDPDRIALPDDMEVRDGILYVTSSGDRSIRAYTIQSDGFLPPEEDSRTQGEDYYAEILLRGDTLYAAGYSAGRIDLYRIGEDGMLAQDPPFFRTQEDPASYPADMINIGGILYVAQAGLNRIDAYLLDSDGVPPPYPSSSTAPAPGDSFPLSIALHPLTPQ